MEESQRVGESESQRGGQKAGKTQRQGVLAPFGYSGRVRSRLALFKPQPYVSAKSTSAGATMFAELQACARMAESEQREFAWHLVMESASFLRETDWCHLQRDGRGLAWERFAHHLPDLNGRHGVSWANLSKCREDRQRREADGTSQKPTQITEGELLQEQRQPTIRCASRGKLHQKNGCIRDGMCGRSQSRRWTVIQRCPVRRCA